MYGLLGDLYLSNRIGDQISAAQQAETQAQQTAEQISQYEERLDKLTLICMALWSMLKEKNDFSEDDLRKRVEQIDLLDGRADGRMHFQVTTCPQCQRTMTVKLNRCQYCGYTPPASDFDAFHLTNSAPPGETPQP